MESFAVDIFVFCMIAMAGILGGVAIQAFTDPSAFIKWLRPAHFVSRLFLKQKADAFDSPLAWTFGIFSLIGLLAICFALGSFFTTILFHLWTSPLSDFVMP